MLGLWDATRKGLGENQTTSVVADLSSPIALLPWESPGSGAHRPGIKPRLCTRQQQDLGVSWNPLSLHLLSWKMG